MDKLAVFDNLLLIIVKQLWVFKLPEDSFQKYSKLEHIVLPLVKPLKNLLRNIMVKNWFSSYSLVRITSAYYELIFDFLANSAFVLANSPDINFAWIKFMAILPLKYIYSFACKVLRFILYKGILDVASQFINI